MSLLCRRVEISASGTSPAGVSGSMTCDACVPVGEWCGQVSSTASMPWAVRTASAVAWLLPSIE